MKHAVIAFALLLVTGFGLSAVAAEAPSVDVVQPAVEAPSSQDAAFLAELAGDCSAPQQTGAFEDLEEQPVSYECPWYTTYCRRASDCIDYCDSVVWAVCQNGCCSCLG